MQVRIHEYSHSTSLCMNPLSDDSRIEPIYKQPFVSAILQLKDILRDLLSSAVKTQANIEPSDSLFETNCSSSNQNKSETPVSSDPCHFGSVFLQEFKDVKEEGLFLNFIKDRRYEIHQQKEHWRFFIEKQNGKYHEFYSAIESTLKEGKLVPDFSGCGGAYFLINNQEVPNYVIKPVDEDIFCLNNRKELGSTFNDDRHRVRNNIPLYRSAQTDAFCWEMASLAGLEGTTPKTVMGIINQAHFYDFTNWLDSNDQNLFISQSGSPDLEKLCSIQEFITDSQDLFQLLHDFYHEGLSDDEIASRFDQKDFEMVCLFLWLSYDNDAHGGNFLTFVKKIDDQGKKIYGIKKIDNGLSFPEKNTQYTNILTWMPNALFGMSTELKQKISNLPIKQILNVMNNHELFNCQEAFIERVAILKELSQREKISLGEIDLRLSFLSRANGKELVLSPMSTQEIINLLISA